MSGFIGILNLDGAPVDQPLLQRLTDALAFRGPDAQNIWSEGNVGFGHTLLRTTFESEHEKQPCSLDGQVWITADVRLSGRADLINNLEGTAQADLGGVPDVELILHAYRVWGEECVHHLLGDFAFAIWDGCRQRLFCARDHFGIKPFFYAHVGNCLVVSNTLNCVRKHPAVSDRLNDLAIADFLLFDYNQEPGTTTFADIQRLLPGHTLTWSEGSLRVQRYWSLPVYDVIRYKRAGDYVDRFKELFNAAVADCLRTDRVGVLMSGGLDSPSVAAMAHRLLSQRQKPFDLRAYTVVYDRLIPDQERHYSGLVAQHLGIPIHYIVADDYKLYERWDEPALQTPEPSHEPERAVYIDMLRQAVRHSRVILTGYGADPGLYPSDTYFPDLIRHLRFDRLLLEVVGYAVTHGRRPPLFLRTALRRWLGKRPSVAPYPTWLSKDFESRLDLQDRWTRFTREPPLVQSVRARGYQKVGHWFWPYRFESCDPDVTGFPIEQRHPYFDLRLMSFLLAVPPMPWCAQKELLRLAFRGVLPEAVRLRPKSPLAGDTLLERVKAMQPNGLGDNTAALELGRYVLWQAIPPVSSLQGSGELWVNLRPLSLNAWLRNMNAES